MWARSLTAVGHVNFAVIAMLGLEQAFTFDERFAVAGFITVP